MVLNPVSQLAMSTARYLPHYVDGIRLLVTPALGEQYRFERYSVACHRYTACTLLVREGAVVLKE